MIHIFLEYVKYYHPSFKDESDGVHFCWCQPCEGCAITYICDKIDSVPSLSYKNFIELKISNPEYFL